ncbi:MAG: TIM barrel protein, partial [Phycisphaerae bacterium]|nr:TIM barrel protein [Phycisphaerae bacterium]
MKDWKKRFVDQGINLNLVKRELKAFAVETPSWGYAQTGTRFGKFLHAAAASSFEQKVQDAAEVHRLTRITPRMAVHVLWDFPDGFDKSVVKLVEQHGLRIGAINPNVFQDQVYKFGSFGSPNAAARRQAIRHCLDSIEIGRLAKSDLLSLWFADGTNFPGQDNLVRRKRAMAAGLAEVHAALPRSMKMLIEYKPFEPATYSTDIQDWGMAALLARSCGPNAKVLVDTGHHLLGTNIEQIVAVLLDEGLLGGFHFNDRKYADDDLTVGSIDPYQAFRIFHEIFAAEWRSGRDLNIAY